MLPRVVDLSWVGTDDILLHLRGRQIYSLNLSNSRNITNESLADLREMPLQQLNLENCNQITDTGLAHLKKILSEKQKDSTNLYFSKSKFNL